MTTDMGLITALVIAFMAGVGLAFSLLAGRNVLLEHDLRAEREARVEAQERAELLRRQLERESDRRDAAQRMLGAAIRDWHEQEAA